MELAKNYQVRTTPEQRKKINDLLNCGFTEIHADDLIAMLTKFPKSAENPLQGMELTPEFEAVEPRFKVGDPVYFDLSGRIAVIEKLDGSNDFSINNSGVSEGLMKNVCLANQENYDRLQATFPHIKFEKPPKPLVGSDLARALIEKGWVGFNCLCGHSGDENAITDTIVTGINNAGQFTTIDGRLFSNAIPMKGWRPLKAREVGL